MSLIGKVISSSELRARWLYADLGSTRHGKCRQQELESTRYNVAEIAENRANKVPYDDLSNTQKKALSEAAWQSMSNLVSEMKKFPTYKCTVWSKIEVCRTYVVPDLDPRRLYGSTQREAVPYLTFIASPVARNPSGEAEETDPKYAADKIPIGNEEEELSEDAALIIIPFNDRELLLDGTFRSILFIRSMSIEHIPVWTPVETGSYASSSPHFSTQKS